MTCWWHRNMIFSNLMNDKFWKCNSLSENVTINEQLPAFWRRFCVVVKMHIKANKCGINYFTSVGSVTYYIQSLNWTLGFNLIKRSNCTLVLNLFVNVYNAGIRTKRCPIVILFHLLPYFNIASINSYRIYKSKIDPSIFLVAFLKRLAFDLIKPHHVLGARIATLPASLQKRPFIHQQMLTKNPFLDPDNRLHTKGAICVLELKTRNQRLKAQSALNKCKL